MPLVGFAEHCPDQPVEQIDGLVRFPLLATDNRNYQPGVLRLNIAPIGSVIPKNPGSSTAFKSVERQVGYRHCHAAILHYKKCRFRGIAVSTHKWASS
jgi:hypothetical protein